MCGIYCNVRRYNGVCEMLECELCKDSRTQELLSRRGPDVNFTHSVYVLSWKLLFEGYILWMQGNKPVTQPTRDSQGNVLLWNGDIFGGKYQKFSSEGHADTAVILQAFVENESSPANIIEVLSEVNGPWSVIYWNESKRTLWFGRDALGRHSLLWRRRANDFTLTSVARRSLHVEGFQEVPTLGIFSMDFSDEDGGREYPIPNIHLWNHFFPPNVSVSEDNLVKQVLKSFQMDKSNILMSKVIVNSPYKIGYVTYPSKQENAYILSEKVNELPSLEALQILLKSWKDIEKRLDRFIELLKCAVKVRVQIQPGLCKDCIKDVGDAKANKIICTHPKVCVLFSGGIDSTVLALLADLYVPKHEAIDLLNVAFGKAIEESVETNSKKGQMAEENINTAKKKTKSHKISVHNQIHFSDVPDRKTGKIALTELKALCPNRVWNFVEIDVPQSELSRVREEIISDLINPLNTVLDDSLGCAMWFASRGVGYIEASIESETKEVKIQQLPYVSPARVALLGNGADEQLGGYSRHRSALEDEGWDLLAKEMEKQVLNLPSRNLGRDDRICSDHGRQPRFPFLDENVVSFLSSLPPWEKVAASVHSNKKKLPKVEQSTSRTLTIKSGVGDKALLRLAALKLGLRDVCSFPKRAMQFGSRIAKLEAVGKEKANDVCQRLVCK